MSKELIYTTMALLAMSLSIMTFVAVRARARAGDYLSRLESYDSNVIELHRWMESRPLSCAPLEYLMCQVGLHGCVTSADPRERRLTSVVELKLWLDEQEGRNNIEKFLTASELDKCHKNPDVLRAMADQHEEYALEADSIGDLEESVKHHETRAAELRRKAQEIEDAY